MTDFPMATVRLAEVQIPPAAQALARAFSDDPMWVSILPDEAQRRECLPWFMEASTRYVHLFGEAYTTDGAIQGGALWLPPGGSDVSPGRLTEAGFMEGPARVGEECFGRFVQTVTHFGELRARRLEGPFWYLMVLGVDPPRQGRGVGGALLQPVLARADAAQLPCYLETTKPRNVSFYRRHGFEVLVEDDAPGGLHFWAMMRPPRR